MKNLVLLMAFIFVAASTNAYSFETKTKECMMSFEDNLRTPKDVKQVKAKKTKKSKVKSE